MAVREKPGAVKTTYVYGHGLLYEVDDTTGNVTYYHYDSLGSTIGLTNTSANITDRFEYSPYGAVTYRTGSTDTPFLYVGQAGVMTEHNGLLYMRARYYSPQLMRFINADPIGFAGGMNWYAYVGGNPMSAIDPSGFCGESLSKFGNSIFEGASSLFSGAVDFMIGEDSGLGWSMLWSVEKEKDEVNNATSGITLPVILNRGIGYANMLSRVFAPNQNKIGFKPWHAGTNSYFTKHYGLIGVPFLFLADAIHETPLDWKSYTDEIHAQGIVNQSIDSVLDMTANIFGIGVGLLHRGNSYDATKYSIEAARNIPGPLDMDPAGERKEGFYTQPQHERSIWKAWYK